MDPHYRSVPWPIYGPVNELPLQTHLRTTPKIKFKKNRNKDFTYCLSQLLVHGNRSLVSKFQALRWETATHLTLVLGASYITDIPHCHLFFAVAIWIYERPVNLWEASKFVLLWVYFLHHFCSAYCPAWTCPKLRNLLSRISNINKMAKGKKWQIS